MSSGFLREANQLGSEEGFFSALTSNKEDVGLNILDRFCDIDVGGSLASLVPLALDELACKQILFTLLKNK